MSEPYHIEPFNTAAPGLHWTLTAVYLVSRSTQGQWTCDCAAATFQQKQCKHIRAVKDEIADQEQHGDDA